MGDRLHPYSTGKFGRWEEHADQCRAAVKKHIEDKGLRAELANEFIREVESKREKGELYHKVWQRFDDPKDCLEELKVWLA